MIKNPKNWTIKSSISTVKSDRELRKNQLISDQKQDFNKIAVLSKKLDKPTENRIKPKPMASVIYLSPLRSQISLLEIELDSAALFHMRERLDVLFRLLAIVAILSSRKSFPENSAFQVTAAKWQIQRGSNERSSQAAHLALMVRVNGFDLTDFVEDTMAIECIKHLHTHTHEVLTEINEVDSWMEKVLLREIIKAIGSRYMQQCTSDLNISKLENLLHSDYVLLAKEARLKIEEKLRKVESKRQTCNDVKTQIKLEKKIVILNAYWEAFDPMQLPESVGQSCLQQLFLIFGG